MNNLINNEVMNNNKEVIMDSKKGVYFLKNTQNNLIKIGCSKNIKKRVSQLKKEFMLLGTNQNNIKLLGFIKCENYFKLESDLHKKFKNNLYLNEWFKLSDKTIEDVIEKIDVGKYKKEDKKKIDVDVDKYKTFTDFIVGNSSHGKHLVNKKQLLDAKFEELLKISMMDKNQKERTKLVNEINNRYNKLIAEL